MFSVMGRHYFIFVLGCATIFVGSSAFMPNFFNTRNYYRTFMESQAKQAVTKERQSDSIQINCGASDTVTVSEWDWQNCIFTSSSPFKEALRSDFSRPLCISKFCNEKEHLMDDSPPPSFPHPQFEHFPFHHK